MYKVLLAGIILVGACVAACCHEQVRLIDNMEDPSLYSPAQPELGHKWTGSVSLDTSDFKEGHGCLRFEVHSAKTGSESFPQWGRSFDAAESDWTGYRALRYWVKVVSDDPTVTQKRMCIVVYNGNSPLQQLVTHYVPVGKWVQLTDNIVTYNRDRVSRIIIYLYETDPSKQDNYTWWVDGLELLPMPEGAVVFDNHLVQPYKQPKQAPVHQLVAQDGLALVLDSSGRVVQLRDTKGPIYAAGDEVEGLSGLMIRDWRTDENPRPVAGKLKRRGLALTQHQAYADGLSVSATYSTVGDRIRCRVTVKDSVAVDRPLTLYFALPLQAEGWTWWDDIRTKRTVTGSSDFLYQPWYPLKPRWSAYPFCCISNQAHALSLALPLSPPRIQHMVYDPRLKLLYIAYDFCLSPAAVKQHQAADFEFYIFRSDPRWGFRSTVQKYYDYFPKYFEKRIPEDGGWVCWGDLSGNSHLADLGFKYHWGTDDRGPLHSFAGAARWDNQNGVLAFPYVEWTNMHVSMEGYETASSDDIMDRVRYIADPDRGEPLPRWQYCFPYNGNYLGPDYEGWMEAAFQAYLKSLLFTPEGKLYGGADRSEFNLLVAKYIPCNADPDIPGGIGRFFLDKWWPAMEKYYRDRGALPDGLGWDNFYSRGASLDYRREHFAYADEPLLFDPDTLQPAILKDMSTYELQKEVVARLRAEGRYLIANMSIVSMVPATLPLLDIFGYEGRIRYSETYARTMGRHKPVCSLPTAPQHYQDPFVRDHLLYGCWPGGYYSTTNPKYVALMKKYVPLLKRLNAAGWEPLTLARTNDDQVQIERFGGTAGRELLFTLKNHAAADKSIDVTVDRSLVSAEKGACVATELTTNTQCPVTVNGNEIVFTVHVPAGLVMVVAVSASK